MPPESPIFESIKEYKPEFKKLVINSVVEILNCIAKVVEGKEYIGSYYNFPEVSYKENGFPSFSKSFNRPTDYTEAFGSLGRKPLIVEKDLSTLNEIVSFVDGRPNLKKRFILEHWENLKDDKISNMFSIFVTSIPKDIANRYIHTHKTFTPQIDEISSIYSQIEEFIFSEKLNIDIVVPILFVKFNFDTIALDEKTEIRKIDNQYQLARNEIKSYRVSVHDSVVASATHALILKGWYVHNSESIIMFDILSNPLVYPIDQIDKFFGAVRLIKQIDTGYAQLMAYSIGWARHFKADLPNIEGTTIRSYPSFFENYYWNSDTFPEINTEEAALVGKFYLNLLDSKENSINIAIKRLNQCLVRDNEEDSVLDATIALEALFSDGGNQEMTYKLAMRAAALSKLDEDFEDSPNEVFNNIKKIYGYRSAIVHGSKDIEKKRVIKLSEEKNMPVNNLAIKYLKQFLTLMIEYPEYRDAKMIDEKLLLNDTKGTDNNAN